MAAEGGLLRAGSWQAQGEAALLKTASDVLLQVTALQGPKHLRLAEDGAQGKTNSVDSSSTAAGAGAQPAALLDSATLLPPLRQISLDIIAASELNRAKGLDSGRGNNIFQDVFNELASKEDTAPLQGGQLYTLPSMQFLENMLSDFDSRSGGSSGVAAMGSLPGPLDLPGDVFDLPDLHHPHSAHLQAHAQQHAVALRPTPFDQQQAVAVAAQQHPGGAVPQAASAAYSGFVPLGGSAPAAMQVGPSGHCSMSTGSLTLQASMQAHSVYAATHRPGMAALQPGVARHPHPQQLAMQQQHAAAAAAAARASAAAQPAVRQPAVPQPAQPRATPRRQSHAYADFDYEEAEVSLQTSKSGRVRKVASFTGVKRRLDVSSHANGSDSRDSRGSVGGADVSSGEVGSKGGSKVPRKQATGARGRKGRRTVCLNCGCHQTPQWRCGPLGPRTLCNACGVRYKKDLPLNCWPIRDGMVLPPGAVLPPGFVVPPGITIHTQPADFE